MLSTKHILKIFSKPFLQKAFAFCKTKYILCILFILLLAIFNCIVIGTPHIEDALRDYRAKARFNDFWVKEGSKEFSAVGIEPTKKIYNEELASYLKKYHEKNPSLVPEKHVAQMKEDFKKWWETSGKQSYVIENNLIPNKKLYDSELDRYIKSYTKGLLLYRLVFIPEDSSIGAILTSWLLFPGVLSFLIFSFGFLFSFYFLCKRWGYIQTAIIFACGVVISNILFVIALPLSYFDRYSDMQFLGASLPLAILLGAVAASPKKTKESRPIVIIAILITTIDILLNWNIYPNIFGLVSILSPILFASGIFIGKKLPRLSREGKIKRVLEKQEVRDPIKDRKKRTRETLKKGLDLADKAEYTLATKPLEDAVTALLQEYPLDLETIKKATDDIFYPNYFLEIPSVQWMEWGIMAGTKNIPEIAVRFFEKSITLEQDKGLLRRALYQVGELRLRYHIDEEKGREELKKVLEMSSQDILSVQVHKLLGF